MRTLWFLGSLLLLFASCSPTEPSAAPPRQPTPLDSIEVSSLPKGLSLYNLQFPDSIAAAVAAGEMRASISYHRYNQVGEWDQVRRLTELELRWGLDSLDPTEAQRLREYHLASARDYLLGQAESHNLVIFSEAHPKPEHRVFLRHLLTDLYDRGYRHLGMEGALSVPLHPAGALLDSTMAERGYPLLSNLSGIYTSEPQYGNLIREASRLGFSLFGYDSNGSSESERDRQQAEHIIAYRKAHPEGKIVLLAGWFHAVESDYPKPGGHHWMAYHYRQLTGDDPLTVYQDALDQKMAPGQTSSPYYDQLNEQASPVPETPQVVINEEGKLWRGPRDSLPFDVLLWSPPVSYPGGIPNWLHPEHNGGMGKEKLRPLPEAIRQATIYPAILAVRETYASDLATPIFAKYLEASDDINGVPLRDGPHRWELIGSRDTLRIID